MASNEPGVVKYAFKEFKIKTLENKWTALCRHCNDHITEYRGTTSGFTRHLKRKHAEIYDKYVKERNNSPIDPSQPTVSSLFGYADKKKISLNHPEQTKLSNSLVSNLIVNCGMPLSIVEKASFRQFISDLNPKFSIPSRGYISSSLIPQMRESIKLEVTNHLSLVKHIALTLDIWTDRRCHSYLAMTAHTFINCNSQSFLLSFNAFKGSHTGVRISEEIEKVLDEHNLKHKVNFIVTDNASNMKKALEVLKMLVPEDDGTGPDHDAMSTETDDDTLWQDLEEAETIEVETALEQTSTCTERLSCFAHSLQLLVKDGLAKSNSCRGMLAKCSKLSNVVHQSAHFREAFENKFGAGHSIPSTNETRWSSVFRQLHAIAFLDQLKLHELLRDTANTNLILSTKEHGMLTELVEILQPFAEATDLTQGDQYATIGCVIPSIVALFKFLTDILQKIKYHGPVAKALMDSLSRRFGGLLENLQIIPKTNSTPYNSNVYMMASCLDPNFGFIWLEEDHLGDEATKKKIKEDIIDLIVKEAEQLIIIQSSESTTQDEEDTQPKPAKTAKYSLFSSYSKKGKSIQKQPIYSLRSTLLNYFEEIATIESSETCWDTVKNNKNFAILSPLFEKIFCTPATSAPVERVFSHSGLFMRPHRARMGDQLLSDLVYIKCNSLAKN